MSFGRATCFTVLPSSPSALAYSFAQALVSELRKRCPDAAALYARKGREAADLGIEENGVFDPLLRVANPSKAVNVMSLWVRHHNRWEPTFVRGTPAEIAAQLAGPFDYLWRMHVAAMGFELDQPPPKRRTAKKRP